MSLSKTSGDKEFRQFAKSVIGPLGRFAYSLCGDRDLAQDLVQTCLMKVYRACHGSGARSIPTPTSAKCCCAAG